MTLLMTPAQVALMARQAPWIFFGGMALFIVGLFSESDITMTGMLAAMLGASVLGVHRAVFVVGVWFLTVLLFIPSILIYCGLSYLHVWHLMEHPTDTVLLVSLTVATWLIGKQSRFLLTVTVANWRSARR